MHLDIIVENNTGSIKGKNPDEAMQSGLEFVRCDKLPEGISQLQYAKNSFINQWSKTGDPDMLPKIDRCYLLMMSATFGPNMPLNYSIFREREAFFQLVNYKE